MDSSRVEALLRGEKKNKSCVFWDLLGGKPHILFIEEKQRIWIQDSLHFSNIIVLLVPFLIQRW